MKYCCLLVVSFFLCHVYQASAQTPVVNSVSPQTGSVGTVITIDGNYLSDSTKVLIGKVSALVVSKATNQLKAMVMPGTISSKVLVYTRSGSDSSYTFIVSLAKPPAQQLQKLTGSGEVSDAQLGFSTAISADNNTIAIGGPADSLLKGAVWVYSRSTDGKWAQYGNKLVPSGITDRAQVGQSIAISADGNTLVTGGILDSLSTGSAWVFVRDINGNWIQQAKLVGTGVVGAAQQGMSVAISGDGNTIAESGNRDSATILTNGVGAIWVFTRDSLNRWTQQGNKLIGAGAAGSASQGSSLAMSADGNTLLWGGIDDSSAYGAAWVFVRDSGNAWTQQGSKLKAANEDHSAAFGFSAALSADGTTAVIGSSDSYDVFGGTWVFVRDTNGVWTQQSNKLVATDPDYVGGHTRQGKSVGISADGNTVISGAFGNYFGQGAAWIFTRNNGSWSQYGGKLLGTDSSGYLAEQGYSVSLNAEGTIALSGAPADAFSEGACWVFGDSSQVLPVTIGNFTAYRKGNGVQTVWQTYNELNISSYIIERSADKIHFAGLAHISATENINKQQYTWYDSSPLAGTNTYRLQVVEKSGVVRYSSVATITFEPGKEGIRVFPNPAYENNFSIQFNNLPIGRYIITVYNSEGKKIYVANHQHNSSNEIMPFQINHLSSGIYLIEITGGQYRFQTKEVVR